MRTVVDIVRAAQREDLHQLPWLLDRLQAEAHQMGEPFKRYIRQGSIRPASFMTLIQPTTIWGLDEGDGPLEGASGPQLGSLQAIGAVLGTGHGSRMGAAICRSRRYLLPRHRRFLEVLENNAATVRMLVERSRDTRLMQLFNGCAQVMLA